MECGNKVAFLGAGNMAEALIKGWLAAGLIVADSTLAVEKIPERRAYINETYGIQAEAQIAAISEADVVVLVVKPQQIKDVLPEMAQALVPGTLVISIVSGVTIDYLEKALGDDIAVVRCMPNTPCMVGASATGFSVGRHVSPAQEALTLQLLRAIGKAFLLPEKLLDAVTGLSGSGPAYVCLMIEALAAGGVHAGLPHEVAQALAAQTVYGTAAMILQSGEHPAVFRDKVTSAAGTTTRGLFVLEKAGLRAALSEAVQAATARAREMGEGR